MGNHVRFKSQTRLWGYDLKNAGHQEEFSQLTIESPNAIQDQAAAAAGSLARSKRSANGSIRLKSTCSTGLQRTGLARASGRSG